MEIEWQISNTDTHHVKALVTSYADHPFVRARKDKNLVEDKPCVDRAEFWKRMLETRMTSAQKAKPVVTFMQKDPFPLPYERIVAAGDARRELIASTLRDHGGIHYHGKIAEDLSENLRRLGTDQGWEKTLAKLNALVMPADACKEREVAEFLRDLLRGFGPKQSRNLLQSLGFTRYEIPIDSRITRWLNTFGFPVPVSATALADAKYYEFVLDAIQLLCAKSGVFPCVLDAAVFASYDAKRGARRQV